MNTKQNENIMIQKIHKDTCLPVLLQISHNPVADVEGEGASLKEAC
jgi:hypothetical protein